MLPAIHFNPWLPPVALLAVGAILLAVNRAGALRRFGGYAVLILAVGAAIRANAMMAPAAVSSVDASGVATPAMKVGAVETALPTAYADLLTFVRDLEHANTLRLPVGSHPGVDLALDGGSAAATGAAGRLAVSRLVDQPDAP